MNRHVVLKVVLMLALIGALIGAGTLAFSAGVTQGIAMDAQASTGESAGTPYPVYMLPYGQPWVGFGGLLCFGMLLFFLSLFLVVGAARAVSGRGHWAGHAAHHGPWGAAPGDGSEQSGRPVPPIFEEWHCRAHAAPPGEAQKI
jgi:uncharacterized membrane protein